MTTNNNTCIYDANVTKFYDYYVFYIDINGTTMYVVSTIINQFNKVNKTNKRLNDWLRLKTTQDLFKNIVNEYKNNDNNINSELCGNSRKASNININGDNTLVSNISIDAKNIYVPGVMQKIYISDLKYNEKELYAVNAYILHNIITWLDNIFGYKLFMYLETIRKQDNDKLTAEINNQKIVIDELQNSNNILQVKISKLSEENEALVKDNKLYEFCDKTSSAVITGLRKDIDTLKEINDNVSKININLVFKNTKLNNMLNESNTRLKELETDLNTAVQHKTKEIQKQINDRLVHDSKPNQWFVKACKTRTRNSITIKTNYCHLNPSPKDIRTSVYCCKNLPNGLVFRREVAIELKDLVEKFGGRQKNISTFVIPVQYINISDEDLDQRIRAAMKTTRKRLGWRHDLN